MTHKALLCGWFLVGAQPAQAQSPAHAQDEDPAMGRRVQALLHAHQAEVFACVQKEAAPPSGELLVRVLVGESGAKVARAEVLKNQTGSKTVGTCIDDRIRGWDVSSLKASEGDQLVFPLAFRPDPKRRFQSEAKK